MIHLALVLYVCSKDAPHNCNEVKLKETASEVQACIDLAPDVAKMWESEHPGRAVVGWSCAEDKPSSDNNDQSVPAPENNDEYKDNHGELHV